MSYFNSEKIECSKEELKKIVEEEACPTCGGDLKFFEGKYLYCEKCGVSYCLKENVGKVKNLKRGYSKGYENYKVSQK